MDLARGERRPASGFATRDYQTLCREGARAAAFAATRFALVRDTRILLIGLFRNEISFCFTE